MPTQSTDDTKNSSQTVVGQGFTVQSARLIGSESIRVDGTVIGSMDLPGTLHVSSTGRIEGNIQASTALIAGQVTGSIVCRDTLHMTATARICGDITTDKVIVDSGAALHGLFSTSFNS